MTNWWIEYRYEMNRRHAPLFTQSEWPLGADTRSLYMYTDSVVEYAKDYDSLKGLVKPKLRANWLFIDIDKGADAVKYTEDRLNKAGLACSKWTMGSPDRAHFHIPLAEPMIGTHVPYSQQIYLKELLDDDGIMDSSIYTQTGQIRMPGTVNRKRRAVKTLDWEIAGLTPTIPHIVPPPTQVLIDEVEERTARTQLTQLLTRREDTRGRHRHIWRVCQEAAKLQLEVDTVVDLVIQWSYTFASHPLEEHEVVNHTTRTYKELL